MFHCHDLAQRGIGSHVESRVPTIYFEQMQQAPTTKMRRGFVAQLRKPGTVCTICK